MKTIKKTNIDEVKIFFNILAKEFPYCQVNTVNGVEISDIIFAKSKKYLKESRKSKEI